MRQIDLEAERVFENRKALGEGIRIAQSKFYWATQIPIDRHMERTLDAIRGRRVLEIGCASGADAVKYASNAKSYVGLDLSNEAISNARALGLGNAEFICTDGHHLPFPKESFDCVIVNSLLHHLDLSQSFREICRVLMHDGLLIFREPLGTNALFQLYRKYTPGARTADERPFTFKDIALMKQYFSLEQVQWFGFLTIWSAFVRVPLLRSLLTHLDSYLSVTPIRYLFWQFSGVARKISVSVA